MQGDQVQGLRPNKEQSKSCFVHTLSNSIAEEPSNPDTLGREKVTHFRVHKHLGQQQLFCLLRCPLFRTSYSVVCHTHTIATA